MKKYGFYTLGAHVFEEKAKASEKPGQRVAGMTSRLRIMNLNN